MTRARLRHRSLEAGITGVRIPDALGDALDVRCRAATTVMPDAVISHATSAALWGLPLPLGLQRHETIHVTHGSGRRTSSAHRRGVTGHIAVLPAGDITRVGGIRVTNPARTFLDLAGTLALDDLIVLGDAIVCCHDDPFDGLPGVPLTPLSELRRRVQVVGRRRGVVAARAALELVRVGADSPPESRLRLMIVRAGLPEPVPNVVIPVPAARRVIQPDLAFREHRLSLQYDGAHHADPRQHARDIERADLTAAAGWIEVRIGAADMTALVVVPGLGVVPRAVAKVAAALRARGWSR
ncbi:hypothetical protein [Tersicoccus solisilvae]|nr:hypothetical protein [Tersicoccus solisilvae]